MTAVQKFRARWDRRAEVWRELEWLVLVDGRDKSPGYMEWVRQQVPHWLGAFHTTNRRLTACRRCRRLCMLTPMAKQCGDCVRKGGPQQISASAREARRAVREAVRKGLLAPLRGSGVICMDCGERPATSYDHRDYGKPLDVEPVCQGCNIRRGPARDVEHLWVKALPKRR